MPKKSEKSKQGCCTLTLNKYSQPIIVYRLDKDEKPIINNEDVLLIFCKCDTDTSLSFNGLNYQLLRGEILLAEYDPNRCKLSKPDWDEMRVIYLQKSRMLEGRL